MSTKSSSVQHLSFKEIKQRKRSVPILYSARQIEQIMHDALQWSSAADPLRPPCHNRLQAHYACRSVQYSHTRFLQIVSFIPAQTNI